jgi:hypothetical protein
MSDYPVLNDFKTFLRVESADTSDDYVIGLCLDSAVDNVNRFCDQTFTAGSVPTGVILAALIQANRYYKRRDAWAGVAGSPDMGNEIRLLAQLDPDVQTMLKPHKLYWWVAVPTVESL